MKNEMTSKERILHTMEWKATDYVPLTINGICHTSVVDLNKKLGRDPFKIAGYCIELGTDTGMQIGLPLVFPPDIEIQYKTQRIPGEKDDILTKEYITPKGKLIQAVRKNEHYPFDEIPVFSDHLVSSERSYRYMIDSTQGLCALEYLFSEPGPKHEEAAYAKAWEFAKETKKFADSHDIIMSGNLTGIGDPLLWLSGVENIVYMGADEPEALHRYIGILSEWNIRNLKTLIDMGVDTVIRRGWYESTDFWSPEMYREFLLPALKKEVQAAHSAGIKYSYIMNTGVDALAGLIKEAGVDTQTNAEPEKCDIIGLREVFNNKVAMCTGINNYHVLEEGDENDIENAVIYALENYAAGGGFILCPSDSVGGVGLSSGSISEKNIENVHFLVKAWKRERGKFK